ncbi:aspartate aminotransferase family protein [Demequina sp. SYSU T00068]|uniref:aspartate aminotransferase family protein n=1 Tax=Demequina lignilytica TaxID=3051663 RepID=UPI002638D638|nr:aspartate aminotransferase family protein [Demequina sp. SYSU T00068]MDN4489970.1 aspartate aminotransferase family protein [Demequina sp. SYSU T00068]
MDRMDHARLQQSAKDHLWMHFTQHARYADAEVPIVVRGEGAYLYDQHGKRYLDGLAGLFVNQLGHGRTELADAAAAQARELAFHPLWSYANVPAIELAEKLAGYAPGDLDRVFFTSGGGEAVESAWKLAKNYFKLTGRPMKHKVISRAVAYHGTTQGALSITGLPGLKQQFEPLVPSTFRVPNTNLYRASEITSGYLDGSDPEAFGIWAADQIAIAIENEGPDTVAAVFLEPVQNAGGCFPPPPGYWQRVREICDRYDVLLVSDEVICAYGRLGEMYGSTRFGYQPDIITSAKGLTSGYAPMGAMIASARLMEPFQEPGAMFAHGYTWGGHPMGAAVALKNLELFETEGVLEHVRDNRDAFRATLERLLDIPIVGDVRGDGYFYGIELVTDQATRATLTDEQCERILYGFLSPALWEAGLYCRADDRGDPVIQLSPPLIIGQAEFDEMESILRDVLTRASAML